MKELWDIEETARRLGTSVRHMRRLVLERRIPHTKVGRLLRFLPDEIEAWVEENRLPAVRGIPVHTLPLSRRHR